MNSTATLALADAGEAADLAAFLVRLLRFDRAAAVRSQGVPQPDGSGVLAVFGRLPLGGSGVLAVRTARLAGLDAPVDLTVSAGQLLDGVDTGANTLALPGPVTGPAWAGLLPPRTGWRPVGEPPAAQVYGEVMAAVREFRERSEAVPAHHRTRPVLDALADEIWSRPLTALPELPLRAAHAARVIGFLDPVAPLTVHRAGGWLRLSAPAGSVALRTAAAPGAGLGLSPVRPS
ncbi:hypothetical protein ADK60_01475 [Streptomyces sp. XY431]|uniref:hypothetical protein n=1 Tax=Streptomyces sp. XY431 TaxID=1415562 RepID=UPI0006AFB0BE|nr:hypothetical protein [Streptomyces sp. XY431]KOV38957.1 hypothetical protein ADK60_01475 [Streptomyces sp. XY431]